LKTGVLAETLDFIEINKMLNEKIMTKMRAYRYHVSGWICL